MRGDNMRDIKRIYQVMALLTQIWEAQQDTRFNQLMYNLQTEYNQSKGGVYSKELWEKEVYEKFDIVSYRKTSEIDLFYVEDEDFLEFLKKKLDIFTK
jgi:hypothetical protein